MSIAPWGPFGPIYRIDGDFGGMGIRPKKRKTPRTGPRKRTKPVPRTGPRKKKR